MTGTSLRTMGLIGRTRFWWCRIAGPQGWTFCRIISHYKDRLVL